MASTIVSPRQRGIQRRGVRQELRDRLPGLIQPFLTAVTGRPYEGERPVLRLSPAVLVALEAVALAASVVIGSLPFTGSIWAFPLLPYAFCAVVGRLRWFQTELAHYAVHKSVRGHRAWAVLGTVIPLAQNERDYSTDHVKEHHVSTIFGTAEDPDAKVLLRFGFRAGLDEATLRRRLVVTLLSPKFHGWFLKVRMKSNLVDPNPARRLVALLWLALLIGLVTVMAPSAWFVMVFGPYTIGYQCSALLQFVSEHLWLAESPPGARRSIELSHGRFCGEAPPAQGGLRWIGWLGRLATVHLFTRLAVLPGTLPSHDAHHVSQRRINSNWVIANYVRTELIVEGNDFGMAEREVWGLAAAIRSVFRSLANS